MRCFTEVQVGRIEALPQASGSVGTVFCNGLLHAVPEIDIALGEVHRVLAPGGRFCFTVPSPRCTAFLLWSRVFERLGLVRAARGYAHV